MLILGIDTSGKDGSLALVRFEDQKQLTLDVAPIAGGTFSAQLIPQLAAMLGQHGLSKRDIDGFAVTSGPGSFTGLRVGLAATKALAEILRKPIVAVSLLEAVARAAELLDLAGNQMIAALDAGRGEVYVGRLRIEDGRMSYIDHELTTPTQILSAASGEQVVTPDKKLAELFSNSNLKTTLVRRPGADSIARLGYEKIQAGNTVAPEILDAFYIRRSDAEVKRALS
jgi:tRNA threonylcarbamoyladenosine biosynthesis protein TsaB